MKHTMTQEQVLRYLELVDRRLYILLHSGVDWDPAYEQELQSIDAELSSLRRIIDDVENTLFKPDSEEDTEENTLSSDFSLYDPSEVAQAVDLASNYDYPALIENVQYMSIVEVVKEVRSVFHAEHVLQQQKPAVYFSAVSDGFNDALFFLGRFSADYLTHIFFNDDV